MGCHVDAYEQAKWFGDEMALKGDFRHTDFATAISGPLFMLRHLGAGLPLRQRIGLVPSFLGDGRRAAESMLENHWRASDDLMARVGLDPAGSPDGRAELRALGRHGGAPRPEGRRDPGHLAPGEPGRRGRGVPPRRRGRRPPCRWPASGRERSLTPSWPRPSPGTPSPCSPSSTRVEAWDAVLSATHASRYWLAGPELDAALEAVADFVDVKSPYTLGHSRGVAALAAGAAVSYGLSEAGTTAA